MGVHDGLIVVTEPTSHFYAVYGKPHGQRRLILERRRPTTDQKLVAQARKAANAKARELGWILSAPNAASLPKVRCSILIEAIVTPPQGG